MLTWHGKTDLATIVVGFLFVFVGRKRQAINIRVAQTELRRRRNRTNEPIANAPRTNPYRPYGVIASRLETQIRNRNGRRVRPSNGRQNRTRSRTQRRTAASPDMAATDGEIVFPPAYARQESAVARAPNGQAPARILRRPEDRVRSDAPDSPFQ